MVKTRRIWLKPENFGFRPYSRRGWGWEIKEYLRIALRESKQAKRCGRGWLRKLLWTDNVKTKFLRSVIKKKQRIICLPIQIVFARWNEFLCTWVLFRAHIICTLFVDDSCLVYIAFYKNLQESGLHFLLCQLRIWVNCSAVLPMRENAFQPQRWSLKGGSV